MSFPSLFSVLPEVSYQSSLPLHIQIAFPGDSYYSTVSFIIVQTVLRAQFRSKISEVLVKDAILTIMTILYSWLHQLCLSVTSGLCALHHSVQFQCNDLVFKKKIVSRQPREEGGLTGIDMIQQIAFTSKMVMNSEIPLVKCDRGGFTCQSFFYARKCLAQQEKVECQYQLN